MSIRPLRLVADSRVTASILRCLAAGLLAVYLTWNVYWLVQQTIPPSLFAAITGLPCPTTGGTRAFRALLAGDLRASLRFNAMAIPLAVMFLLTLIVAVLRYPSRRALSLPMWFLHVWFGLLLVAWVIKLAGSTAYW